MSSQEDQVRRGTTRLPPMRHCKETGGWGFSGVLHYTMLTSQCQYPDEGSASVSRGNSREDYERGGKSSRSNSGEPDDRKGLNPDGSSDIQGLQQCVCCRNLSLWKLTPDRPPITTLSTSLSRHMAKARSQTPARTTLTSRLSARTTTRARLAPRPWLQALRTMPTASRKETSPSRAFNRNTPRPAAHPCSPRRTVRLSLSATALTPVLLPWFPTQEERSLILHYCANAADLMMAIPSGLNPMLAINLPLALDSPRGG